MLQSKIFFVTTDHRNVSLCAAIIGDLLSPDSCRFIMPGMPNVSPPSETLLVAGMTSSMTLSYVTSGSSADTVFSLVSRIQYSLIWSNVGSLAWSSAR